MKKILAIVLGLTLAMSISTAAFATEIQNKTGDTSLVANIVAASMSVTVPTKIVIHMDSTGVITYPQDSFITNNYHTPVVLTSAKFTPGENWSVLESATTETEMLDSNRLAIFIDGTFIDETDTSVGMVVEGSSNQDLSLTVNMPGSISSSSNVTLGTITYTFDLNEFHEE